MSAIKEAALAAHDAGLCVIPALEDGSKAPFGRWQPYQSQRPPREQVGRWYANGRTGLGVVCGAVSGGLEMLEFEGLAVREGIVARFRDAGEATGLGNLVNRIADGYQERSPSGGLHLLYRVEGKSVPGNTKLARRPATPEELAENPDDGLKVLIETRGEGGFTIIAPSSGAVHPSGKPWAVLRGSVDTIPTITAEEHDALYRLAGSFDAVVEAPPVATTKRTTSSSVAGDRPGDEYNARSDIGEVTLALLVKHGWTERFRMGTSVFLRRPGRPPERKGHSAVLHLDGGVFVCFSSSTPFKQTSSAPHTYPYAPFAVLAVLEHGGENDTAFRDAARALGAHKRQEADRYVASLSAPPTPTEDPSATSGASLNLPDEFWSARPALDHIRSAAWSRVVSPDAVFGAVLVRVAAITPHTLEIPAVIGSPKGLSFFCLTCGGSGLGKSAANDVAADLIPAPSHVVEVPMGSGEGMVEILFEMVEEDDDKGKARLVKRQTRNQAIFHVDEGAVLTEMAGRNGATLMPTIRTAFTSGKLGQANASAEKRRIVDGHAYVFGITVGIQPELAGPLLADAAAGTPQRFLWTWATDPNVDTDAVWPGELAWTPPDPANLEPNGIVRNGWRRHQLDVEPAVADEIKAAHLAAVRGQVKVETIDQHRTLVRLKVAALLGLLDKRLSVTDDDWALAGVVVDTSTRVRRHVETVLARQAAVKEYAVADATARREIHVDGTREQRALDSSAKTVGRVVHKHDDAGKHKDQGGGCTSRCLASAMSSRNRDLVAPDHAAEEAETKGWIRSEGERWLPGDSRPA